MLFNPTQIKQLQELLESELGLKYKDEELETAGLAIVRFVFGKELSKQQVNNEEIKDEDK
jgi:hypothetical protein